MHRITRRTFLAAAAAGAAGVSLRAGETSAPSAPVKAFRVEEVSHSYEDFLYRTPIKFGGNVVDRVTLINVTCRVNAGGRSVTGFGSMPLGNVWSFPSKEMSYDVTLGAMKALADRVRKILSGHRELANPVDIDHVLEPEYVKAAAEVSCELKLAAPIPKLCTLVTASPFSGALHDAFGKANGRSVYRCYGPEFIDGDLSRWLNADFKGDRLDRFVLPDPKPRMPLYHLVGAVDPIFDADVKKRVGDGLPETLPEWIAFNGLTHFKIKLNGEDLGWDVDRVVQTDRACEEAQRKRGLERWVYSLDFNEKCRSVGYLLEFLAKLQEKAPRAYDRIQYVEQPTKRDLEADRKNVMHEAAKLKPVVIDESLTGLDALLLARDMGYSGAALKACKGQSQAILMGAVCQKLKMFLCVQDLTCPGASLVHSAGLAAHVPGVAAIEANSRQYVPVANKGWEDRFPGLFKIEDGTMKTGEITGPGLGAVAG